jgi:transposase
MLKIGLDVHERNSALCIMTEKSEIVEEIAVRGHPREVLKRLAELQEPFEICFEASCNYGWLHDQLCDRAARVVVAHPGKLRLIFRSKRKNDRIDARRLAMLLCLGEVPSVYVPSLDVRSWRQLIVHRRRAVSSQTRCKNTVRALLRAHGVSAPRGLWSKRGLTWLASVELPTRSAELQRDQLLDDLEYHKKKIRRVEEELARISAKHPGVALLRTIPGVGLRTAEAFVAFVDDPNRFKPKSIGAYFGIVPRQDASSDRNRLGRITKDGTAIVRGLLTEAAWQGIRRNVSIRAVFERISGGDPDRKKRAIVATAHYLCRVMLGMLRTGDAWNPRTA